MANVVDKAGPARQPACPDTLVNARASITLNACPEPQQQPELLPQRLVLKALLQLLEAALAPALDAFRMRVPT